MAKKDTTEDLIGLTTTRKKKAPEVKFNPELIDAICLRVAAGEAVYKILEEPDMPSGNSFYRWVDEDKEGSRAKYNEALRQRGEKYAEQIVTIADDDSNDEILDKDGNPKANNEFIQRSRLRVDARKWVAARLLPKKYGDKITTEVTGAEGAPLIPEQSDTELARRVAFLLTSGLTKQE